MTGPWIFLAGLLVAASAAKPAEPEPAIRVRIYDYAGVLPATLAEAKAVASDIFHHAGVRVAWAECALRDSDPLKDADCLLPATPADLQVRILDRNMAKKTRLSGDRLGYALLSDGFDSIAAVFFHRTLDLEGGKFATRSAILGAMLAHEIGHLLMEEGQHSEAGIMRASWNSQDLKLIARGRMWFTAEQVRLMRAMTVRRAGRATHHSAYAGQY